MPLLDLSYISNCIDDDVSQNILEYKADVDLL